jgi:hypothetical protein
MDCRCADDSFQDIDKFVLVDFSLGMIWFMYTMVCSQKMRLEIASKASLQPIGSRDDSTRGVSLMVDAHSAQWESNPEIGWSSVNGNAANACCDTRYGIAAHSVG